MESLQTLNFAGAGFILNNEIINIKELAVHVEHPISEFIVVNTTKLGRKVIVTFDDRRAIWLPERFNNCLNDDFIRSINEGSEKFVLVYRGMKAISDNVLDETTEKKESYCKDVLLIVNRNANNHFLESKVLTQLEIENLDRQHVECDKIIADLQAINEIDAKELGELDRQIYNATQINNQAKIRFNTTGDMIKLLKEEAEKLQELNEEVKGNMATITKRVDEVAKNKKYNLELKQKIDSLEKQVKEIIDNPVPELDQKLIQENEEAKQSLKRTIENFERQRQRKNQLAELNKGKLNLLVKINKRQEENKKLGDEIRKEKAELEKFSVDEGNKWQTMEENINIELAKKEALEQNLADSIENSQKTQQKIEDLKANITEIEKKIEDDKEKITNRQKYNEEESKRIRQELEIEKANLVDVEKELQKTIDENNLKLKILADKSLQLAQLKDKKEELTVRLCEKKVSVAAKKCENAELQAKNEVIAKELALRRNGVEELKKTEAQLQRQLEELKNESAMLPRRFEETRKEMESRHKEKVEKLRAEQNLNKANAELVRTQLNNTLKEVEGLKKEIKDMEKNISWKKITVNFAENKLATVQEKYKKELVAYEELLAKTKKKETSVTNVHQEKKIVKKPKLDISEPKETMEMEDDDFHLSGRKSPGILKNTIKEKRLQTPNKRVTFEGLSSTESSSISMEAVVKNVEEETLNDFLEGWDPTAANKAKNKPPMDF